MRFEPALAACAACLPVTENPYVPGVATPPSHVSDSCRVSSAPMVRLVAVAVFVLILSPVAGADAPATPTPTQTPAPVGGQRFAGVGAEIGFSTGVGPALHLGTRQFGLYVAAGIMPILIFGNEQGSRSLTFDAYRAFELNADVYILPISPSPRTNLGLAVGYSGNTVLGNGFNLGYAARYDLRAKLAFTLFGGIEVFPDARDHLAAHGYPMTQDASLPQVQGGVNVGLVLYP